MTVRMQKQRQTYFETLGFNRVQRYALSEALEILKKMPKAGFLESVEFAIQLGIDAKRSDQTVRGSVTLPNGTGREVKVAVFASADRDAELLAAGADWVGIDVLMEMIQSKQLPFQVLIAHPEQMPKLAKLGPILGPKGLMPNPKLGTVSTQLVEAIKAAKSGQIYFRNDKAGLIHGTFGKLNFSTSQLVENLEAVLAALRRSKPTVSKGVYLKQIVIASTMSPGLKLNLNALT